MKTALEYFQETAGMSIGDIIRHHGYGTEAIQQHAQTPWYYLPYIRSSRIDLAAFQLFKDGWYHPADISKWFMSLMPVRPTTQETSAAAKTADPPYYDLTHLHLTLVLVWDTLVQYPKEAEKYKAIGSVIETLTALIYRTPPFVDYFAHDLINSAHFRYSVCEYILNQRGDYHLGNDRLPPTDEFPEGSQAKKDRDVLFDKHKNTLFRVAHALQVTRPSDVYYFARSCPDFFFVDEMEFYYGGAGRTCADILMTRMAMSLDEAKRIATDYVREHTPTIDYREIFNSLDDNCFGQKHLIPVGHIIESVFPDPAVWIGAQAFNRLLQQAGITCDEFETGFSELCCANEWLRPFVRISGADIDDHGSYNQLHFDPETGCSWRLREPHA
jgi:hypothetical protein